MPTPNDEQDFERRHRHWEPVRASKGWLVSDRDSPNHFIYVPDPDQWIGALVDALLAAPASDDPRLAEILETVTRVLIMSQTTQGAVDHVAAAVVSLRTEVRTDVAGVLTQLGELRQEIVNLKAAGGGATVDQIASLEASASDVEASVKALHDGLAVAPAPAPVAQPDPAPSADVTAAPAPESAPAPDAVPASDTPVVFNAEDPRPNVAGGRNTSHLPNFDATVPETA